MSTSKVRAAQRARCLTVASECTGFGLRKAARALGRIYDEAMAPTGLRATQFNLLVALSLANLIASWGVVERLPVGVALEAVSFVADAGSFFLMFTQPGATWFQPAAEQGDRA